MPGTPTSRSSGKESISKDAPYDLAFLPEELALGVGRPVLVVPRYGTFDDRRRAGPDRVERQSRGDAGRA